VWAHLLHVLGDAYHDGDGAEGSEDARGPARVADIGVDAVLLGDLDVVTPYVHAAGEDGDEDAIGAL